MVASVSFNKYSILHVQGINIFLSIFFNFLIFFIITSYETNYCIYVFSLIGNLEIFQVMINYVISHF